MAYKIKKMWKEAFGMLIAGVGFALSLAIWLSSETNPNELDGIMFVVFFGVGLKKHE